MRNASQGGNTVKKKKRKKKGRSRPSADGGNEDGDDGFSQFTLQMLGSHGEAIPPPEAVSLGVYYRQSAYKVG